jgi:hypothetical protein
VQKSQSLWKRGSAVLRESLRVRRILMSKELYCSVGCLCGHLCVYMCACLCVYVYACLYICVCMSGWLYRQQNESCRLKEHSVHDVFLDVCLCICLSVYRRVMCLSVCMSVCITDWRMSRVGVLYRAVHIVYQSAVLQRAVSRLRC